MGEGRERELSPPTIKSHVLKIGGGGTITMAAIWRRERRRREVWGVRERKGGRRRLWEDWVCHITIRYLKGKKAEQGADNVGDVAGETTIKSHVLKRGGGGGGGGDMCKQLWQ